jgi:hypothetical protein
VTPEKIVVPDGIEPQVKWRTWLWSSPGALMSHNQKIWSPGIELKAECTIHQAEYVWSVMASNRGGMTSPKEILVWTDRLGYGPPGDICLPDGLGWGILPVPHEAPVESCACGIYAADTIASCPRGQVYGTVKLWGKIVLGTKGSRAEFAYPDELWVPARMKNDPAILAYGVPVHAIDVQNATDKIAAEIASSVLRRQVKPQSSKPKQKTVAVPVVSPTGAITPSSGSGASPNVLAADVILKAAAETQAEAEQQLARSKRHNRVLKWAIGLNAVCALANISLATVHLAF